VVSLVFWCAKGGSEDSEPSLLGRECRVSDPNVCSKRFQVGRRDARKVPDLGFATVELDVRAGPAHHMHLLYMVSSKKLKFGRPM